MVSLLAFVLPILPVILLSLPCLFWSYRDIGSWLGRERSLEVSSATLVNRAGRLGFRQTFLYFALIATLISTVEVLRPEMLGGMGYFWVFLSVPSVIIACFFARYWARSRTKSRLELVAAG